MVLDLQILTVPDTHAALPPPEVTRILSRSERLTDDDAIKKFYFRDLSKINFSNGDKIVVPKIKNTKVTATKISLKTIMFF